MNEISVSESDHSTAEAINQFFDLLVKRKFINNYFDSQIFVSSTIINQLLKCQDFLGLFRRRMKTLGFELAGTN